MPSRGDEDRRTGADDGGPDPLDRSPRPSYTQGQRNLNGATFYICLAPGSGNGWCPSLWVQAVEFVESFEHLGAGQGGYNEDQEFCGYRMPI